VPWSGLGCGIVGGVPALDLIHAVANGPPWSLALRCWACSSGAVVTDMLWRQFVSRR